MMKKKNYLFPILAAALFLGSCQFENFDERCAREAKEYTEQHCPLRIDPCTVLDSMTYASDKRTLQYYYTMEGLLDSTQILTPEVIADFKKQLEGEIVNSVQLRKYKEERINFRYCYKSKKSGKTVFDLRFTPEDYETAAKSEKQ